MFFIENDDWSPRNLLAAWVPALRRRAVPDKIVLSTAFTGVRFHPDRLQTPDGRPEKVPNGHLAERMPVTAGEVGLDARASYMEGSRYFHLHARNPQTARQSADPKDYRDAIRVIKHQFPLALVSGPTSRKEDVGRVLDARMDELEITGLPLEPAEVAQAELARALPAILGGVDFLTIATEPDILNPGAIRNFDQRARARNHERQWPETILSYFNKLTGATIGHNIRHEVEIMHTSMLDTLEKLTDYPEFRLGAVGGTVHAVVLLGFSQALPVRREAFDEAMQRLTALQKKTGLAFTVSVGAVIMPKDSAPGPGIRNRGEFLPPGTHDYREVIEWVIDHNEKARTLLPVSIFRTGLEDAPVMYGQQQTNASLARIARGIFFEHGITLETNPHEVSRILGVVPDASQARSPEPFSPARALSSGYHKEY